MYRSGRAEQAALASRGAGSTRPGHRCRQVEVSKISEHGTSVTRARRDAEIRRCRRPCARHARACSEPQVCDATLPGRQASGSACAQDMHACSEPQTGRLKNPGSRSLGHGPQARHNGTTRRAGNRNSRHDDSAHILSAGLFGAATFFTCRHCRAGCKPPTTPAEKKIQLPSTVRCKHFSLQEVIRNRALTSKFVWTGAWPTLLFKDDSIAPRIHSHYSNTHIAHTYPLVIDFEIRLDSLWQVLCSYPRCFTPAHHPAGLSARDRHRLSQHHPYDLALYLSPPPLSVWPGPTRPDLDPRPDQHDSLHRPGPARPDPQPGPTRTHPRRALNCDSTSFTPAPHTSLSRARHLLRAAARVPRTSSLTSRLCALHYGLECP